MESSRHVARTGVWSRGPAPGAELRRSSLAEGHGPALHRGLPTDQHAAGKRTETLVGERYPAASSARGRRLFWRARSRCRGPAPGRRPRPSPHAQQEGPGRTALQTRATSPHCHLPAPPTPASTHAGRRLGRLLLRIELGGDLLRNQRLAELHTSGGERRHAGAPGSVSRCNVFSSSST